MNLPGRPSALVRALFRVPILVYRSGFAGFERLVGLRFVLLTATGRRSGLPRDTVKAIRNAYKTLFLQGKSLEEGLEALKASSPPPEVMGMLQFIEKSQRGITRPALDEKEQEEVAS